LAAGRTAVSRTSCSWACSRVGSLVGMGTEWEMVEMEMAVCLLF
jgi:hypothetical protein